MIEAREQWLVDAQTVRELREKARAALDSDEIPLIAIGMVQKYTLRQLGLWDQDGERFTEKCPAADQSNAGHKK